MKSALVLCLTASGIMILAKPTSAKTKLRSSRKRELQEVGASMPLAGILDGNLEWDNWDEILEEISPLSMKPIQSSESTNIAKIIKSDAPSQSPSVEVYVTLNKTKSGKTPKSAKTKSAKMGKSGAPSQSPSSSVAPSVSLKPSQSPSLSDVPSVSLKPSLTKTGKSKPGKHKSGMLKAKMGKSGAPSQSPSDVPSVSLKPSQSPSDVPSVEPSQLPSVKPSQSPSDVPSVEPSQSPSDVPSRMPSQSPSDVPSRKPSQSPSDVPSAKPSQSPSDVPSGKPSQSPSQSPSDVPTTWLNAASGSLKEFLNVVLGKHIHHLPHLPHEADTLDSATSAHALGDWLDSPDGQVLIDKFEECGVMELIAEGGLPTPEALDCISSQAEPL